MPMVGALEVYDDDDDDEDEVPLLLYCGKCRVIHKTKTDTNC